MSRFFRVATGALCVSVAACSGGSNSSGGTGPISFARNPCSPTADVNLAPAEVTVLDCSGGGTTVTLAGQGASYLVVPQFATNSAADLPVGYQLTTGSLTAAALSAQRVAAIRAAALVRAPGAAKPLPSWAPGLAQRRFDGSLLASERTLVSPATRRSGAALVNPPALGSLANFKVPSSATSGAEKTVTAQLQFIGSNIYLYIDTTGAASGFNSTQLAAFGTLFDQTLYDIDLNAFGPPSDIDGNGHVIMLMSPVVNGLSPSAQCATQGYIAGFFYPLDLSGGGNNAEIFYSIVPDPTGRFSCTHTVDDVGAGVPATFVHELQHLINFSQHVVIAGGAPQSSWLDEGMSIVAEELGSLYYEAKCPPPACRTTPDQIFPDSSQGFVAGFLYDSYQYALLPDTASLTLHNDGDNGFAWRGGDWALVRYLADHYTDGVLHSLETAPSDGLSAIASVTGQPFASTFAAFGLALYADSFPGLPRNTAPDAERFMTRNLRQLWSREYVTEGPATDVPLEMPLVLYPIVNSSKTFDLNPGTMTFWRLDTAASDTTVSIEFSAPGGSPLSAALRPQIAIMRLPAGQ